MWNYHDTKMKELKALYNRTSKQTQKKLQEIFDTYKLSFDELYNIANTKTKKMIDTQIDEWEDKELLKDDFGNKAKNIRNRTRVKNNEILMLLIYGAYIEEQSKLQDKELNILSQDVSYYYKQGQEEVNKTLPKNKRKSLEIPTALLIMLLDRPIIRGYLWKEYIQSAIEYNAEQIYRQAVIDIQQLKDIKIDSDIYQGIIKRQQTSKLNINGDKISGAIDNAVINMNNQAKIEGMTSIDNNAKVRFIAVEDNVTTKMCRSLDGQIFNVNKENIFTRYDGESKTYKKYKCMGLVTGLNLPPISSTFHWCRSSVTYQIPLKKSETDVEVEFNRKILNKRYKEYTKEQIILMAKEMDKVANKHTNNDSKWSRKINFSDEMKNLKEWDCSITTYQKTSPQMLLHEQLHAHSISYYGQDVYIKYKKIEEASVELLNKEICKVEKINYEISGYDNWVKALENINKRFNLYDSQYDYAQYVFNIPVDERLDLLRKRIYNINNIEIEDLEYLNEQLEILGG